jgi:hypothetical protein
LANIKNSYSVWGTKKSVNNTNLPIHARYAIDRKPVKYHSLDWYEKNISGEIIMDEHGIPKIKEEGKEFTTDNYDWRELIYRMAVDFYRHNQESDFLIKLSSQFPNGKTGYEQYYSDLRGYWR